MKLHRTSGEPFRRGAALGDQTPRMLREGKGVAMTHSNSAEAKQRPASRIERRLEIGIGLVALALALATAINLLTSPPRRSGAEGGRLHVATSEVAEGGARDVPRFWGPFRP